MADMKLALYLPNFRDHVTIKELEDLTALAEELEFDSIWTLDRIIVPEASAHTHTHTLLYRSLAGLLSEVTTPKGRAASDGTVILQANQSQQCILQLWITIAHFLFPHQSLARLFQTQVTFSFPLQEMSSCRIGWGRQGRERDRSVGHII